LYEEIFDIIDREADNGDSLEVRYSDRLRLVNLFCDDYRVLYFATRLLVVQVQVWVVISLKNSMIGKNIL
jgi:hypothetical protein